MKMITLFILITLNLPLYATSECRHLLEDCEYYMCINEVNRCGRRSYFQKIGFKYCTKFNRAEPKLTDEGKAWVEKTKKCLINQIHHLDEDLNCKEFKKAAIKQHAYCYLNSGYCELKRDDKRVVIKTIISAMWRPSFFHSGLKVLNSCRKHQ